MSEKPPSPVAPLKPSRGIDWQVIWALGAIVAAVFAAYASSVSAPFVFDDQLSIVENPTIRQLSLAALVPPSGQGLTVEGRPLLNLSLALNYAISGLNAWSYHLLNVAIHLLAALTLFGLVRRTLAALNAPASTLISLSAALLWTLHPLQTESVTYLVQRTESLMGLFYLLTLYCFARGATTGNKTPWFALSVVACALGMATKEVMVSAPLIVLLFDRTFIAGSFRDAWARRSRVHLALAATWLLLAVLVIGAGNRGGTIGTSAGVTWWQYAMCQARAIIHYLQLAVWPSPLIFDYGSDFVTFGEFAPFALLDLALLGLTAWALWRRPVFGFLGAWFFVILAPTTSVVGGTRQMLAEHRMYLSLAALVKRKAASE
jgi:protein O-mannosyl-transferase